MTQEAARKHKTPEIVEVPEPAYRQPEPDVIVVDRVEAGDRALETARKFTEEVFTEHNPTLVANWTARLAALIQFAMNVQERELRAKIKPMLDNLHTKPQPETGAWWRGECESNCHACKIERLLAEQYEGRAMTDAGEKLERRIDKFMDDWQVP